VWLYISVMQPTVKLAAHWGKDLLSLQELCISGAEEHNYGLPPFYTRALGSSLRALTCLTKLHFEFSYDGEWHEERMADDDYNVNCIADSVTTLRSLRYLDPDSRQRYPEKQFQP